MKSSNMTVRLIVFFVLIFGTAALGYAAATVTISPSGNGQVIVQGDGFAGVEGIEIDIKYDNTSLTNPRVTMGSLISGMPMITSNDPGRLRFSGTYAFPKTTPGSSGTIAAISFDTIGNSSTTVIVPTATLKDAYGTVLPVSVSPPVVVPMVNAAASVPPPVVAPVVNVTADTTNTGTGTDGTGSTGTGSGTAPPSAAAGSAYPVVLGTVSMPDAGTPAGAQTKSEAPLTAPPVSEPEKIQKQTTDAVEKEIAPPTGETAPQSATQEKSAVVNKSVLERFREYQGEQSPKNLIALFKSAITGNGQEPPLALSDGTASVKVFVDLPATGKAAPNFAMIEAKLVSIKKTGDSAWVVEVLPNKGTFDAALIVIQDGKTVKLPLTVAPPLSADSKIGKEGVLSEADFISFLKERGTGKAPRFDLNGDGKMDYIDDYIFTANFLARADAAKPAAEKKSQGTK